MNRRYFIHYSKSGEVFILTDNDEKSYNFMYYRYKVWEKTESVTRLSLRKFLENYTDEHIEPISEKKLILMGMPLYEDR